MSQSERIAAFPDLASDLAAACAEAIEKEISATRIRLFTVQFIRSKNDRVWRGHWPVTPVILSPVLLLNSAVYPYFHY